MPAPRRTFSALVLLAAGALVAAGCGSSPPAPHSTPSAATPSAAAQPTSSAEGSSAGPDWLGYHGNAAHAGLATDSPAAGKLSIAWTRHLDGAVYGQPLVVGGTVIAATEGDTLYGLVRATGAIRWRRHVGTPVPISTLPCGNIDPLGITGTTIYDRSNGLVYAVAETTGYHHVLVGVSASTGALRVRREIPTPDGQPRYDQQRAALALEHRHVYVAFGGLDGDCGPYRGSVVSIPASGKGPTAAYRVPTAREGGIWAAGGPVIRRNGTIYVSVGNGASTGPPFDGSDSVTALSPGLRRTGIFAPSTWGDDNAHDLDLGSMSPVLLANGDVLAVGKRGIGYLMPATHLGGVAGQAAQAPVCTAFGGAAVNGTTAYVPCTSGGLTAVATAGGRIHVLWHGPGAATGSPVLGGGAVWVPDWNAGVLYELNPANGQVRAQISLASPLPHFASPSLSGALALIGTKSGVVAVHGV